MCIYISTRTSALKNGVINVGNKTTCREKNDDDIPHNEWEKKLCWSRRPGGKRSDSIFHSTSTYLDTRDWIQFKIIILLFHFWKICICHRRNLPCIKFVNLSSKEKSKIVVNVSCGSSRAGFLDTISRERRQAIISVQPPDQISIPTIGGDKVSLWEWNTVTTNTDNAY